MKIKCKATDLHTAIDAEWDRKQQEGMKERDTTTSRNNRNSVGWTGDPPGYKLRRIDPREEG